MRRKIIDFGLLIINNIRHSSKHKRIAPPHVADFRRYALLLLIIKISVRRLHVVDSPRHNPLKQRTVRLYFIKLGQGHCQLAGAMDVNGILPIVIILWAAVGHEEIVEIETQTAAVV